MRNAFIGALLVIGTVACGNQTAAGETPAERRIDPIGFTPGSGPIEGPYVYTSLGWSDAPVTQVDMPRLHQEGEEVDIILPDVRSPLLTWSAATVTLREPR